jgi:hypothetical protein
MPTFCSQLDLVGVKWPTELSVSGQAHLGLALNITGSFEGRSGWANLSNNFDGMGFSIGLLQQNLGMGSLQPLLNDMLKTRTQAENFNISEAHVESLRSMMSQWNKDMSLKAAEMALSDADLFADDNKNISPYDMDSSVLQDSADFNSMAVLDENKGAGSANKNSVSWALKTIYSDGGTTFKPVWADNLTKMAKSKPYISLQLKYAMKLYTQAFRYFTAFKLSTLSHFILMFDFVVQNGGFKQRVLTEYALKLKSKPNMTAQEKALLILELRIKDVIPRWQNDVSARKKTIIFSEGQVHGVKRNLKSEFCYDPNAAVLTQP